MPTCKNGSRRERRIEQLGSKEFSKVDQTLLSQEAQREQLQPPRRRRKVDQGDSPETRQILVIVQNGRGITHQRVALLLHQPFRRGKTGNINTVLGVYREKSEGV